METYLFLFICFCIFQYTFNAADTLPAAVSKSGPFVSSIVKATECRVRTKPIDPDPSIFFNAEVYSSPRRPEKKLIRGNVTVVRDCRYKKIKVKGMLAREQNQWKLVYLMNNMGCNSLFMPIVTTITAVRYDKKNCVFFKGTYMFEGIDTNKTQHLLSNVQEYGTILWRNEFFSQAGSVLCWEFETRVEPPNA